MKHPDESAKWQVLLKWSLDLNKKKHLAAHSIKILIGRYYAQFATPSLPLSVSLSLFLTFSYFL